jgi:hypothetical protein
MAKVPYQLTPEASKGNAFCWMSWEPQINWRSSAQADDTSRRQTEVVERNRAGGNDMLHVAGLSSQLMPNLRQFAIATPPRKVA